MALFPSYSDKRFPVPVPAKRPWITVPAVPAVGRNASSGAASELSEVMDTAPLIIAVPVTDIPLFTTVNPPDKMVMPPDCTRASPIPNNVFPRGVT